MSKIKLQPDHIFTGTEMMAPGHVLIASEAGVIEGIVPVTEAGDDIHLLDGILIPGLVNCHCHLELSHMKGLIPEHTGLVDFVFKVVNERHFPEEEILGAIEKAEDEMIANGIVAVGDICNNLSTLAQKTKRRLQYYNFVEVSGWMPAVAEMRYNRSAGFFEEFSTIAPGRTSLSPHAPYSVSEKLWELIMPYFDQRSITIHNQETAFEDDLFLTASGDFSRMYELMKMDISFFQPTGKSSLQSYFSRIAAAKEVILVHNTFTKEADVVFAQQGSKKVNWCICINANRYIEQALPPIDMLREHKAAIVIGTDSLASNHTLSILDELRTIQQNFPHIPLPEMLQWATLNGAKALQMDNTLGSFEKGKQPGIMLLKNSDAHRLNNNSTVQKIV